VFREYARGKGLDWPRDELEADGEFVHHVETQLAGVIGASSSRIMVASVVKEEALSLDEVRQIVDEASQVVAYSHQLEQKSKELEAATSELRAANERLQELDRLKDEFVSTVSHELRTPLTSIRSFSAILREDPDVDIEKRKKFLDIITKETERLTRFFANLPGPVDHVLVSGAGPQYVPFAELDIGKIRHGVERIVLSVQIARLAKDAMQPTGSLLLIGGTGGRRPSAGPLISAVTAAMPALARSLALELAPIRVNVVAPGFVDTTLSAEILGAGLDARREQLRTNLPIRRVIGPEDVAALAIDLMKNTAITGATFDIDGGQQLIEG